MQREYDEDEDEDKRERYAKILEVHKGYIIYFVSSSLSWMIMIIPPFVTFYLKDTIHKPYRSHFHFHFHPSS
jgi:hypothetical protein